MNQTNIKVDPDDKKMKLDKFVVKKNRPWPNLRRSVLIFFSQV